MCDSTDVSRHRREGPGHAAIDARCAMQPVYKRALRLGVHQRPADAPTTLGRHSIRRVVQPLLRSTDPAAFVRLAPMVMGQANR